MAMQYLIDTDWSIHCLHGVERVMAQVDQLKPAGIGISIISIAELYDGVVGATDPERSERDLQKFLAQGIALVELDVATCRLFARERSRLRRAGTPIGDFDLMIGATALRHNLTLLTNNRRHFQRINGLTIISV